MTKNGSPASAMQFRVADGNATLVSKNPQACVTNLLFDFRNHPDGRKIAFSFDLINFLSIGSSLIVSEIFCRVHQPAFRTSGCSAAISRHEIFHGTALLLLRRPSARKAGLVRFVRNGIALPIELKRAIPFLQKTKRKNMNTTENFSSTLQPSNDIVQPVKFPPQPQEWKIVSLRECPTPADIQLCDTPVQAAAYWKMHITPHPYFNPECECLVVLILNTRKKIKGHYFVSIGTMDTILVHPREVFRLAIMASASAIILMHNHPSNETAPSEADVKVTRDLVRAGQLLKIEVLDHVVVGNFNYSSLRELGYMYQ